MKESNYKKDLNLDEMFDIPLFSGSLSQVLSIIKDVLGTNKKNFWIATVNPEFIMKTSKDGHFMSILKKTDLNVIDGKGLAWALGRKLKRRVEVIPGSDLIDHLCNLASKNNWNVYFLGGFDDRAKRTAQYFESKYGVKVAGFYAGMSRGEDNKILEKLGKKRIDILFVAYGMQKQEEWIARNIKKLNVGVVMGVGRSFDYYSGDLKRASILWRKLGLEWLYSLIKQPYRIKRQMVLPKFVLKVLFPVRD